MADLPPEVIAVGLAAIGYQHIPQRIPIGHIVPERAVAQLHPGIMFVPGPERAIAVEEKGQPAPALVADEGLLVNGIPFPEPVGDGQTVGQGLPAFTKQIVKTAETPTLKLLYC